jgi:nicotinamidase-related amidase
MLLDREHSSLLVVDVQERLLPAIDDWQRLLDNVIWLVRVAQLLKVPVLASEQYPKGLGHTHADLRALLPSGGVADKVDFSCVAADCLDGMHGSERRQMVICGIEAHVCVLQTALEMRSQSKDVFVVADAVGSRGTTNRDLALARMRGHGIEIVSREMVAFEWMRRAGTAEFRQISSEFLR